jgi:tetratricopeptide (TPR) repeat protein
VNKQIWFRAQEHFHARRFPEAIADCEYLIHGSPVWPMGFPLLSSIYLHLGQPKLATYYATAATQHLDGLNWEGVLSISTSLIMVGENQSAHRILSGIESRGFSPKVAAVHLGRQLSSLEDIPNALLNFQLAIASGDKSGLAYQTLGLSYAHLGDFQQAATAYEAAMNDPKHMAHTHWARSQLPVAEGAEIRIQQMKALLSREGMPETDIASLAYGLFKEYDRLDEIDQAWHYLMLGAEARRSMHAYDANNEDYVFNELLNSFSTPKNFAEKNQFPENKTPIFIVGMPRTGTTLLERILGNHADIISCGELTVLHQQLQWVADTVIPISLDDRIGEILAKLNFSELGQRYMQKTNWLTGDFQFFSDKNPMNFNLCGAILAAMPNAKIIHMQRNPFDTCFSNLKELFAPGHYPYSYRIDECISHYKNYAKLMRGWHKMWPGKILDVKYEDLVLQPTSEANRIFDYLGINFKTDILDITKNKNITTTASSIQVREAIHFKNVDGWKRYAIHLQELEQQLHEAMARYASN